MNNTITATQVPTSTPASELVHQTDSRQARSEQHGGNATPAGADGAAAQSPAEIAVTAAELSGSSTKPTEHAFARVEHRPIGALKPHPINADIYGDDADDGLVESIRESGILVPLVVTPENEILGGSRRFQAACKLGQKEVPVVVRSGDPDAALKLLLDLNVSRRKSMEQRLREYENYRALEAKRANRRKGARTDLRANLPAGEAGRAREIAAAKVGMSARTAEDGLKVLTALHEHVGERHVPAIRKLLQESVNAAFKRAQELRWIAAPKRQRRVAPAGPCAEHAEASEASAAPGNVQLAALQRKCAHRLATGQAARQHDECSSGGLSHTSSVAVPPPSNDQTPAWEGTPLAETPPVGMFVAPVPWREKNTQPAGGMPLPTRRGEKPLFIFLDGSELQTSTWPFGWISANEVALKLTHATTRSLNAGRHKLTDPEILQLQRDLLEFARVANNLAGPHPSAQRLQALADAISEVRNIAAEKSSGLRPTAAIPTSGADEHDRD